MIDHGSCVWKGGYHRSQDNEKEGNIHGLDPSVGLKESQVKVEEENGKIGREMLTRRVYRDNTRDYRRVAITVNDKV